jgi:demethylmenaquinone methyltransferase/2-methoxy-6-polyprenyl-1,4-benzoquinol methylase
MFGEISSLYDLLTHVLSFGRDFFWRKALARRLLALRSPGSFLDLAAGTGDQLIAIRRMWPQARLTGLDFAKPMLALARKKFEKIKGPSPTLVEGDALSLPFQPDSFDSVSISFGLRNIKDRQGLFRSVLKVLKPGGRFLALEMFFDPRAPWAPLHRFHLEKVGPFLGDLAFGRRTEAYRYLADSIKAFPHPAALAGEMELAGFQGLGYHAYTFGAVMLAWGGKPF